MKSSFLYQKYKKIVFGLGLFVVGLVLFFSISITISSRQYLERFIQHNSQITESYFTLFEQDSAIRVSRWSRCPNTRAIFLEGDQDGLDGLFAKRVETIGFSDVRISLKDGIHPDYLYKEMEIPEVLYHADHEQTFQQPCFHWVGEELWYATSDQIDNYLVLMAVPIHDKNLQELTFYLEGNLLNSIEIGREDQYLNRDIFHWKRLIFSVNIDQNIQAYLTYHFEMDSLVEYFYLGYGITTIAILLFFFWMIRYNIKHIIVQAYKQTTRFEQEMKMISDGDYSKRVKASGYYEFDRLGTAVNQLTATIEERNRELSDHVQELYGLLIQVLEQKDPYTRGHSERVAEVARGIALVLGLENAEEIHSAGLLHDVGKIAIAEELLNKPERYSEDEYERVKDHARKGYELLMESKEFHRIRYWVLYHHERIDGSGYPEGLKGMEIPYEARVIAVADVFDAMTSDRSYRSAMAQKVALKFLNAQKGIRFQAEIVEALETYLKASS